MPRILNENLFISKTPLRISLFGGGSDLPSFIQRNGKGSVVNLTINKFVYSVIKIHGTIFDKKYRLNYFNTENVNHFSEIKNNIIRGTIKYYEIPDPLYISTISDVPSGTGLGSSGAFLVGLCSLMNLIKNKRVTKAQLASEASTIDINLLKSQGGYQDQFASAFGGFNKFTFYQNGNFKKEKINLNNFIKLFEESSVLVFTGKTRKSNKILSVQNNNMKNSNKKSLVLELLNLGDYFLKSSNSRKDIYQLYIECMNESWKIKKELSKGTFDNSMEGLYSLLKKEGMKTGKILGAGGGGFFLASFLNYEEKNFFLSKYRKKLKILEFNFYDKGSQIL